MVVLLFGIWNVSCKNENNAVQPPSYQSPSDLREIIPLKIGNSWKYVTVDCGDIGSECDTTLDSTEIIDTVWVDNKKHFVYNGASPHFISYGSANRESVDSLEYVTYICLNCFKSNSLGTPSENETSEWLPVYILKTPIVEGNEWKAAAWDSSYGYNFGICKITKVNVTITTSVDTFEHAIEVKNIVPDLFGSTYYIVPGIGVVKQEQGNGLGWSNTELTEWNIN